MDSYILLLPLRLECTIAAMAEKIAIVHDWLNGMRGGEKVLEELLALYPAADVFTLFYEPERVSPLIRSRQVTAWVASASGRRTTNSSPPKR